MNSEEVKTYLPLIQGVVSRMAANSANCKTWCVTLITALFALAIDKGKPAAILLGLFPLALFCFVDAYYLSLERDFIAIYNEFVEKLRNNTATANDAFMLTPANTGLLQRLKATLARFNSFSIWPFYGIILLTVLITYAQVRPASAETSPKGSAVASPTATPATR